MIAGKTPQGAACSFQRRKSKNACFSEFRNMSFGQRQKDFFHECDGSVDDGEVSVLFSHAVSSMGQ